MSLFISHCVGRTFDNSCPNTSTDDSIIVPITVIFVIGSSDRRSSNISNGTDKSSGGSKHLMVILMSDTSNYSCCNRGTNTRKLVVIKLVAFITMVIVTPNVHAHDGIQ